MQNNSEEYLTVSLLTQYLKRKFDYDPYLQKVYLTGEISNFRLRPNAHQYFSIKDDNAKIKAIMFKSAFQKVKFTPEEGMKVLVVGRISLFEASGDYQIYVEKMEPDGIGSLYAAYEQLKKKLTDEGLFNFPKEQIPHFPKKIAVITSQSGAVIRDIITTVNRRYPLAEVVLFPAVVQGELAKDSIIQQLNHVERLRDQFDTLIIGRGGGSIEDLWVFNEEEVVRKITEMDLPVISSVGHETDTTLSDFVADVRAATPTAAAELATPNLVDELANIREQQNRMFRSIVQLINTRKQQLENLQTRPVLVYPDSMYREQLQLVDQLQQRLYNAINQKMSINQQNFLNEQHRLLRYIPSQQINDNAYQLESLSQRLKTSMMDSLNNRHQDLQQKIISLDNLSPLKVLARGYTFVSGEENKVVSSIKNLAPDDQVKLHFNDGNATAKILEIEETENGNI